jgi:hypothetical protein
MADRKYVTVIISGFSLGGGTDVYLGEVVSLPAKEADAKIAQEFVRESTPEEVAAYVASRDQKRKQAARETLSEGEGDDDHPEAGEGDAVDRDPATRQGGRRNK